VQQNGDGIGFFPSGAARTPDTQRAIVFPPARVYQARQNGFPQGFEVPAIAEKIGLPNRQHIDKLLPQRIQN
jgi:hypothetical protein